MTGVTWDERKPGDWLASNGRWYPKSQRPRNWDTLALPPAPGHGGVTQLHGRRVESVLDLSLGRGPLLAHLAHLGERLLSQGQTPERPGLKSCPLDGV